MKIIDKIENGLEKVSNFVGKHLTAFIIAIYALGVIAALLLI